LPVIGQAVRVEWWNKMKLSKAAAGKVRGEQFVVVEVTYTQPVTAVPATGEYDPGNNLSNV